MNHIKSNYLILLNIINAKVCKFVCLLLLHKIAEGIGMKFGTPNVCVCFMYVLPHGKRRRSHWQKLVE